MRMKKILLILSLLSFCLALKAQESDSTNVSKPLINDYSMIGVNYGVTFSNTVFNPSKHGRAWVTTPNYISIMYTKYSKMFDYLPYFGLTLGVAYGHEGYAFNPNESTGFTEHVDGATWCSMDVIEVPAMMQGHIDMDPFKIMANVGVYGGYRRSIERKGIAPTFDETYAHKFKDYEHTFDYGMQGGLGFGIMVDPVEIHFNCLIRWSWSTLYAPDYYSKYYYRFANPVDIMATVGVHFQLQKRTGKTTAMLRRQAKEMVYGKTANSSGSGR